MGFNTLPFIFIFLPVFLAVYYLMPERLRNGVLTLGSLVFYLLGTWKRPWCLALLLGLMALTWLSGRKLAGSKPLLVGNLLVLGLCLFGFKYAGLLGSGIALPLGLPKGYWEFLRAYRPVEVAAGLDCPLLVLQGERDYQVTMQDYGLWLMGLLTRPKAQLKSYPALNHLLQEGKGKSTPLEYNEARPVPSCVADDVAGFIRGRDVR